MIPLGQQIDVSMERQAQILELQARRCTIMASLVWPLQPSEQASLRLTAESWGRLCWPDLLEQHFCGAYRV